MTMFYCGTTARYILWKYFGYAPIPPATLAKRETIPKGESLPKGRGESQIGRYCYLR